MLTQEKRVTRRTGLQALLIAGWASSSAAVFVLLIAVPHEFALNPPIQCDVYALARRGWGCARFGDAASNPFLFWSCVVSSIVCAIASVSTDGSISTHVLFVVPMHIAFLAVLVGSVRFVYYIQGHVTSSHAWDTTAGFALVCTTAAVSYLVLRRVVS